MRAGRWNDKTARSSQPKRTGRHTPVAGLLIRKPSARHLALELSRSLEIPAPFLKNDSSSIDTIENHKITTCQSHTELALLQGVVRSCPASGIQPCPFQNRLAVFNPQVFFSIEKRARRLDRQSQTFVRLRTFVADCKPPRPSPALVSGHARARPLRTPSSARSSAWEGGGCCNVNMMSTVGFKQ